MDLLPTDPDWSGRGPLALQGSLSGEYPRPNSMTLLVGKQDALPPEVCKVMDTILAAEAAASKG